MYKSRKQAVPAVEAKIPKYAMNFDLEDITTYLIALLTRYFIRFVRSEPSYPARKGSSHGKCYQYPRPWVPAPESVSDPSGTGLHTTKRIQVNERGKYEI